SQLTSRRPAGCCPGAAPLLGSPSRARNATTSPSMVPLDMITVGFSLEPLDVLEPLAGPASERERAFGIWRPHPCAAKAAASAIGRAKRKGYLILCLLGRCGRGVRLGREAGQGSWAGKLGRVRCERRPGESGNSTDFHTNGSPQPSLVYCR